jgi:hypothetical protein
MARYVVRRWERFIGKDSILVATGQTFSEVGAARNAAATGRDAPPPPQPRKRSMQL